MEVCQRTLIRLGVSIGLRINYHLGIFLGGGIGLMLDVGFRISISPSIEDSNMKCIKKSRGSQSPNFSMSMRLSRSWPLN